MKDIFLTEIQKAIADKIKVIRNYYYYYYYHYYYYYYY